IIGAGNMGSAIARLFGSHGWHVVLVDPSQAACTASRERLLGTAADGKALQHISWSADLEAAKDAALIIEAAPENADLKRDIFQKLEACCAPSALIATNTSGISI